MNFHLHSELESVELELPDNIRLKIDVIHLSAVVLVKLTSSSSKGILFILIVV